MLEIEIYFEEVPGGNWVASIPAMKTSGFGTSKDEARIAALQQLESALRTAEEMYRLALGHKSVPEKVTLTFHTDGESPDSVYPYAHPGDYKLCRKLDDSTYTLYRLPRQFGLPWGYRLVDAERDERGYLPVRYWALPRLRPSGEDLTS